MGMHIGQSGIRAKAAELSLERSLDAVDGGRRKVGHGALISSDPNQIAGVRRLIKELGRSKTILVSTHILQEVQPVADRVIFIHDGKIVFDGPPSSLPGVWHDPSHVHV